MYIVELSPLKTIKGFKSLSYFSSHKFEKFDIVEVPFRNGTIQGVVISSKELKSVKADVKDKSFAPKKIKKQKVLRIADEDFLKAVEKFSKEYLLPLGPLIAQAVPSVVFKHINKEKLVLRGKEKIQKQKERIRVSLINDFEDARLDFFKALVRQKLAQGYSILLVSPNSKSAKKLYDFLSPGISSMLELYDTKQSPKKRFEQIQKINSSDSQICVVGTPAILFTQPKKLGLIIIEKEHSQSYKRQKYPFANMRDFASKLAEQKNLDIVFADSFLRLENYMALFKEEASSLGHIPKRLRKRVNLRLIDLQKEINYNKEYKLSYPVVSREILGEIARQIKMKNKIFIFNPKKDYANQIICNDCATVISCPKCNAQMRLQEDPKSKERRIICLRCGFATHSNINCPNCQSWRLKEYGIGIDMVHKYLQSKFPELKIIVFDSNKIKSEKAATEAVNDFYNSKDAALLLGTQKALAYLDANSCNYSAALSVDSLLSVPDFQMEERIFSILTEIMDKSSERFDLQVKDKDARVIKLFYEKDIQKFVKSELKLREKLLWPPYTRLIKVSTQGSRKFTIEEMQKFIDQFAKYKPRVFRDFVYIDKKTVKLSALLRVARELWPNEANDLWRDLYDLPANFEVEIDPNK